MSLLLALLSATGDVTGSITATTGTVAHRVTFVYGWE